MLYLHHQKEIRKAATATNCKRLFAGTTLKEMLYLQYNISDSKFQVLSHELFPFKREKSQIEPWQIHIFLLSTYEGRQ